MNRDDNPVDDGSKGLKFDIMLKNDPGLKGLKILWQDESHWPRTIPALTDDDPEIRKEARIYAAAVQSHVLDTSVSCYSPWSISLRRNPWKKVLSKPFRTNELPVIGYVLYKQRVLGSPGGKHSKSMHGGNLFDVQNNGFGEKTENHRWVPLINAFFDTALSEIDLGNVDTWQV